VTRFSILLNADHEHRELMGLARQIEARGFHTLWYADERYYRETYTGLAACALSTERLTLGTCVTDPYTRHPALTAMAAGSLDELSGGRAVIGIGAGRSGFHNIGQELIRPARRIREAIEIVRGLLAGERLNYRGEIFQTSDLALHFPTRADIPVYLAADGPYVLRVAGELADGVIIGHCASPKIVAGQVAEVRRGMERAGRTVVPKIVARLDASISRDREAAVYQAKVRLGRYLWIRFPNIAYLELHGLSMPAELVRRFEEAGPPSRSHDLRVFRRFADAIPDEQVFPITLAGTPHDVAGQIRALVDAGVDEVMAFPLVPETETTSSLIDLFAEAAELARA
jgi:5,10-methylenetetrahydromethanopterin reductase